jgi:hypothetical protein
VSKIILIFTVVVESQGMNTTLSHFFFRDFSENIVNYLWNYGYNNIILSHYLVYQGKRDFFLDRKVDRVEGEFSIGKRIGRDTLTFSFHGYRKEERRSDIVSGHNSLDFKWKFLFHISPSIVWEEVGKLVSTDYTWAYGRESNPGIVSSHYLHMDLGRWKLNFDITGDKRSITSAKGGGVNLLFLSEKFHFETEGRYSDNSYPLPSGRERKREKRGRFLIGGEMEVIPLHLTGRFEVGNHEFLTDFLRNRNVFEGSLELQSERKFGDFEVHLGWESGYGRDDYERYLGDEERERHRFSLSFKYTFKGFYTLTLGYGEEIKRYTYPQRILVEDRDERNRRVYLENNYILSPATNVFIRLNIERIDLAYLNSLRSFSTRKTERYHLLGQVKYRGIFEMNQSMEIAALYSIYKFDPLNNILLRYMEERLSFVIPVDTSLLLTNFRFRWQDQGAYRETIEREWVYYKSVDYMELWLSFSLHLLNILGASLNTVGETYTRYEKLWGLKRKIAMWENSIGIELVSNSLIFNISKRRRSGERPFTSIKIVWNTSLQ